MCPAWRVCRCATSGGTLIQHPDRRIGPRPWVLRQWPTHPRPGFAIRVSPDVAGSWAKQTRPVSRYLLQHRRTPEECSVVVAAFKGYESRFVTARRWRPASEARMRSGGRSRQHPSAGHSSSCCPTWPTAPLRRVSARSRAMSPGGTHATIPCGHSPIAGRAARTDQPGAARPGSVTPGVDREPASTSVSCGVTTHPPRQRPGLLPPG